MFIKIWVAINNPAVINLPRDSLVYWLGQDWRPDGGAVTARIPVTARHLAYLLHII
jgi:hypothetical protein